MSSYREPDPIDVFVGRRIRGRRRLLDLSQRDVADRVGVGFQQVQKYETGLNTISAPRLVAISRALEVPISYFFDGLDEARANTL